MKSNVKLSGFGAEPKKLAILGVLVAVAAYFFLFSGGSSNETASVGTRQPAARAVVTPQPAVRRIDQKRGTSNQSSTEFRPSLKPKDVDRAGIDPTLHTNLLAKLQAVEPDTGGRSLFQFGQDAPASVAIKEPEPIKPKPLFIGPPAPPPKVDPPKPPEPQAPPIPLKFYGFINPQQTTGPKRAFFLDGDDIIVASEGDIIKKRYKILRIGINSAVVEDTQFKANNQQTLPLVEEQAS